MKIAAAAVDAVPPSPDGLVILIYHRVGGRTDMEVDLPTARFEAQVAELAASGRLVSLDEGIARLGSGDCGGMPLVLTFDDGTADWVDQVLPVLVRHSAPATFYVATDHIEARRGFPHEGSPVSWAGLEELAASGLATIGSHTHTHALLDRCDGAAAARELDRSVELIGERLGIACRHFAYPKALLGSSEAEREVRRRFQSASLAGSRPNRPGADPHRLLRTPIQRSDGMRWFRRKASGGMWFEDRVRDVVNRHRYRRITT